MDDSSTKNHPFYRFKYTCLVQVLISLKLFSQSLWSRAFQTSFWRQLTRQLEIKILNRNASTNMKNQLAISCQYDTSSAAKGSGAIIPSINLFLSLSQRFYIFLSVMVLKLWCCIEIAEKMNSKIYRMEKNRKKADNFVDGIREHCKLLTVLFFFLAALRLKIANTQSLTIFHLWNCSAIRA